MVDTKTKLLFWVMAVLIVFSVSASYYRYMILHDYVVQAEVDCDPTFESCFVWECDPSIVGECTGNEDEDTWYYKYAYRNAKNITDCEDGDMTCQFTCTSGGEDECAEVLCTSESIVTYDIDGECTNPVDFQDEILEEGEEELSNVQIPEESATSIDTEAIEIVEEIEEE